MKTLTMIVHADSQQRLSDVLRAMPQVTGFTYIKVEGHGAQAHLDPTLSTRDLVVGYTPRVRVDILLEDGDAEQVLEALSRAGTGVAGQCVYWVTSVDRHGRL